MWTAIVRQGHNRIRAGPNFSSALPAEPGQRLPGTMLFEGSRGLNAWRLNRASFFHLFQCRTELDTAPPPTSFARRVASPDHSLQVSSIASQGLHASFDIHMLPALRRGSVADCRCPFGATQISALRFNLIPRSLAEFAAVGCYVFEHSLAPVYEAGAALRKCLRSSKLVHDQSRQSLAFTSSR